jgi:hypothetical protein
MWRRVGSDRRDSHDVLETEILPMEQSMDGKNHPDVSNVSRNTV